MPTLHKVKMGSRVKFTSEGRPFGLEGTVVVLDLGPGKHIGVEFDTMVGGHNCDGIAQKGHGWWCIDDELKLISY